MQNAKFPPESVIWVKQVRRCIKCTVFVRSLLIGRNQMAPNTEKTTGTASRTQGVGPCGLGGSELWVSQEGKLTHLRASLQRSWGLLFPLFHPLLRAQAGA